ncbi:MAG TPA: CheR family methyltransferase [Thermoleophilaceae bacterium]|nr:CheR family methyltransferase [Thermoleophilaceae bacterium]
MSAGAGEVTLSPADFDRYRAIVRQRAGIEIPDARKVDLEKGIAAALEASRSQNVDALYDLLAEKGPRGATAFEAMVPAITINETHFFRNRPQMTALEKEILPQLIEAKRETRKLRIWSAACSSGEEPYSLAILIDRLLPDHDKWDILIHGTDIDHLALQKAHTGLYGNWSFREVPQDIKDSYFTRVDEHRFELAPKIRRMVRFSRLNLVDDLYPSPETVTDRMDLVVCRNVLIYFKEETIQRIVDRFHASLVDGGWLVVGHAEPSQEIFHRYQVTNYPGTIVYRRSRTGQGKPIAPSISIPAVPVRSEVGGRRPEVPKPVVPRRPAAPAVKPASKVRTLRPVGGKQAAGVVAAGPADEAYKLFQAGRSGDAINELEKLAAEQPTDYRAPYLLAKIFASKMRFPEAERWIDVALKNRELAAESHYLRGIVLQEQGRLDEALEAFRRSVFLDQGFVLGHFAAAGVFGRTGQIARAKKSLATVAELLSGRPAADVLPEGDGLTVGRLQELVSLQQQLVA